MVRFLPGADPLKFVMVFSSEVGEWVFSNDFTTINPLRNCLCSVSWDPAFLHGALNVMLPPTHLAQFDFSKETFRMVELPGSEDVQQVHALECQGDVCYYALICEDERLRV